MDTFRFHFILKDAGRCAPLFAGRNLDAFRARKAWMSPMTIPWLPPELHRMKAYILGPGIVQIEDTVYNHPARTEEKARSPPPNFEFVLPVKENSPEAARRAMEALYWIVFD